MRSRMWPGRQTHNVSKRKSGDVCRTTVTSEASAVWDTPNRNRALGKITIIVMPSYLGNELVFKMIPYPCFHLILLTLLWKDQVNITISILHTKEHEDVRGEMIYPNLKAGLNFQLYLYFRAPHNPLCCLAGVRVGGRVSQASLSSAFLKTLLWGHFFPLQALLMESSYSFTPHTSLGLGRPRWGGGILLSPHCTFRPAFSENSFSSEAKHVADHLLFPITSFCRSLGFYPL